MNSLRENEMNYEDKLSQLATRRQLFRDCGVGLGGIALTSLLNGNRAQAGGAGEAADVHEPLRRVREGALAALPRPEEPPAGGVRRPGHPRGKAQAQGQGRARRAQRRAEHHRRVPRVRRQDLPAP